MYWSTVMHVSQTRQYEYLGWLCAQRTGVTAETESYEHYVMTDAPNRHFH